MVRGAQGTTSSKKKTILLLTRHAREVDYLKLHKKEESMFHRGKVAHAPTEAFHIKGETSVLLPCCVCLN